jgi:hypothetical protein
VAFLGPHDQDSIGLEGDHHPLANFLSLVVKGEKALVGPGKRFCSSLRGKAAAYRCPDERREEKVIVLVWQFMNFPPFYWFWLSG